MKKPIPLHIQIADLLNFQNQLAEKVNALDVLKNINQYVVEIDLENDDKLIACARVRRLNWYIAEISHLSVDPLYRGNGHGKKMLKNAEEHAYILNGIQMLHATIRLDNDASTCIFFGHGWLEAKRFINEKTGNAVRVMVK